MVKKRAGWLAALFLGEMLTATAMAIFEDEIARAVVLALVRAAHHLERRQLGLAGDDAGDPRDGPGRGASSATWWRVVRRELGAGRRCSAWCSGTIGFSGSWSGTADQPDLRRALRARGADRGGGEPDRRRDVRHAHRCRCCRSSCARLGFDPASASAPFVATLVDVTGLVIYFTVASFVALERDVSRDRRQRRAASSAAEPRNPERPLLSRARRAVRSLAAEPTETPNTTPSFRGAPAAAQHRSRHEPTEPQTPRAPFACAIRNQRNATRLPMSVREP